MLETAYVVTWRWTDGSGSGATAAFMDKARADRLLDILAADQCSRVYKIEAVPFDSAAAMTAGAPGATDAEWWLEHRAQIIDALAEKGLQIVSNANRVWLAPLPSGVPEVDPLAVIDKALAERKSPEQPPQGNMAAEWPARGVTVSDGSQPEKRDA